MSAPLSCYYCDLITAVEPAYAGRPAGFDLGSEAPRCAWHWRFVCDHCGEPHHFMRRFYCPTTGRLLCADAGPVEYAFGDFWGWTSWWVLRCPDCGELHDSLDRAEWGGTHPWQVDATAAAARRWLSSEPYLVRYPPRPPSRIPIEDLTDADLDATWSQNADYWDAGYDERGDRTRRFFSDPVMLAFLGEVAGKRILDAGSGNGYLSRVLAKRGATVVGVENARRFYELAVAREAQEPLGIVYHHASISSMDFFTDGAFDAVVANFVLMDVRDYEAAIAEIARVLRPGGRFVAVITHQTMDFRWHIPAADSPRREDRAAWMDDDYFVRRAGYIQWGDIRPFITFHRPLRDYIAACRRVGLALRDLDEPELSEEGRSTLPAFYVRHVQRAPYNYALKFVKTG